MIHARYSEAWTVDLLAREAGVSKTVLNERFRALLGEAPMQYCGRWRMRAAANMLRDDRRNHRDDSWVLWQIHTRPRRQIAQINLVDAKREGYRQR